MPGQQEIPPAIHPQEERIHDVHAVTRHDIRREVRGVLELRRLGGQDDVAQQGNLGMTPRGAVDRADDRDLDVQQVHQEVPALPVDAVDPLDRRARRERGGPGRRPRSRELTARPRQDDHAVLTVGADVVESLGQLAVRQEPPAQ